MFWMESYIYRNITKCLIRLPTTMGSKKETTLYWPMWNNYISTTWLCFLKFGYGIKSVYHERVNCLDGTFPFSYCTNGVQR